MKSVNFFIFLGRSLLAFYLLPFTFSSVSAADLPKRLADGDRITRGNNRLISAESIPGRQLSVQAKRPGETAITPDGMILEPAWQSAQIVAPFTDSEGRAGGTTVRVFYDQSNIYLFWDVNEPGGITADANKPDMVLTGDDYVQINLKPSLPESIIYGRDYYYLIAVNPNGTVFDGYFDPYLGGHFYSSWDCSAKVAVSRDGDRWSAEMIIPFAGLDVSSDPQWRWSLDFWHCSHPAAGETVLSAPPVGVTVEQGIMVRRRSLVEYYWTRPEFMQEVKPGPRRERLHPVGAIALDRPPKLDGKSDADLWAGAETLEINYSDRTGEVLTADTARVKAAAIKDYLCFDLEAYGAKTKEKDPNMAGKADDGMANQVTGVNGVYVDTALLADECFWIILQPRRPDADNIHQPYYLIKVSNDGRIDGTSYDRFGTPDKNWQPQARVDIYDTEKGWGAEVSVSLDSFDLPAGCGRVWGFNIFRNRRSDKEPGSESELQSWLYTATDFLNPEKMGTLTDVIVDKANICFVLERRAADMRKKLVKYGKSAKQLSAALDSLKIEAGADLGAAEGVLEQVENGMGVIDGGEFYSSGKHPFKGGHVLLDVKFAGNKGCAVGAMGTVLCSENNGRDWQSVEVSTDADLYRVFFIDQKNGWAAGGRVRMAESNEQMRHDQSGGYGYIFHTVDGGKTWQCQYAERGRHLFGLYFTDERTGFACGELGILLKTENGGATWRELPVTGTRRWLYGITFQNGMNGFIVGESETVLKTTDGGRTWMKVNAEADRQFYGFRASYRDIAFNGSFGCIVGSNGTVLTSSDAGQKWQPAATFFDPQVRELLDLTRVSLVSPLSGFAAGELGTQLLVTDDGGKSWMLRPVANTDWLRGLWASANGRVVLAGEREKILVSDNKGFEWKTLHGDTPKADLMTLMAHGDDSAIRFGPLLANYGINEKKQIVDVQIMRDIHSVEYLGEIYNLEHHRNMRASGVRTTTYFDEFENGNNGCDYYHFTQRLWEGEDNMVRHMVAAIRAYRPDVILIHDGVYGEYDKPGHKLSGRAGLMAFETAGGETDRWPQLTRLGLGPWQPKKIYSLASESYPATLDLTALGKIQLRGADQTCWEWSEYVMRLFQSQGIHNTKNSEVCLIKSHVTAPDKETSVFDGL